MKRIILLCVFLGWGCETSTEPTRHNVSENNTHTPSNQMNAPSGNDENQTEGRENGTPQVEPNTEPNQPRTPAARATDGHWSPGQDVVLRRPPVIEPAIRARRRMNLDQLEAAFLQVSDGLNWTERRGNNDVSLFRELSATLGKPDYIQITTEILEPTALFQKFLDDAARQVCQKMVTRDAEQASNALVRIDGTDAAVVSEHLRDLILRFHGRLLAEDSRDLAQWQWLYDSIVRMTEIPEAPWNAVCVALFTHPDFYTY
jgi:hypothetical protein